MPQQPEATRSGAQNYESAIGSLPMGRNMQAYITTGGSFQTYADGWGQFTALLQFTEQSPLYNAINISLGPLSASKQHVSRDRNLISVVPQRHGDQRAQVDADRPACSTAPQSLTAFTSYRGVIGTFMNNPINTTSWCRAGNVP